jgi:biotin carboxylase
MDHSGKKLAILGASYLQLPVVLRAKELGVDTVCFAWSEGAVCKDVCTTYYPISIVEKEQVLEAAEGERVDGLLTIASDVGVPTVSYVAERLELTGNSAESALLSTNKFQMRSALSQAGLNCPKFLPISACGLLPDSIDQLRFPAIVKPVDRSGSHGVTKVADETALEEAVEVALQASLCGEAIVEEFVEGLEVSVETISWEGNHHHLAITDKENSGPPHFVELAHHQPSMHSPSVREEIRRQTIAGLDALKIRYGASHAEFLITSKGDVVVTEIAGRMGGDFIGAELVELSTGYDFLRGIIDVALGVFETPTFSDAPKCSGVYFYSALTPSVGQYIRDHHLFPEYVRSELTDPDLKALKKSADRNGYFLYRSDSKFPLGSGVSSDDPHARRESSS